MGLIQSGMWLTPIRLNRLLAAKTADETVNNSAAFQSDDELTLSVEAGARYRLELAVVQQSPATPGFKFQFVGPAGVSFGPLAFMAGPTGSAQAGVLTAGSTPGTSGITGTAANSPLTVRGLVTIGGTSGSVVFQWAQSTANASNTIVRTGSYLELFRYA